MSDPIADDDIILIIAPIPDDYVPPTVSITDLWTDEPGMTSGERDRIWQKILGSMADE